MTGSIALLQAMRLRPQSPMQKQRTLTGLPAVMLPRRVWR